MKGDQLWQMFENKNEVFNYDTTVTNHKRSGKQPVEGWFLTLLDKNSLIIKGKENQAIYIHSHRSIICSTGDTYDMLCTCNYYVLLGFLQFQSHSFFTCS